MTLVETGFEQSSGGENSEVTLTMKVLKELETLTFAIQYNPNCPGRYLVRLVGKGRGKLDLLCYDKTHDVLGFGKTLPEAAESALQQYRAQHEADGDFQEKTA